MGLRPGQVIPKTIIKMVRRHKSRGLTVQPDCVKGQVACGTVYGDKHHKDLLGSITRVWYFILVPDFYLVLHNLRCLKITLMD